MLKHIFSCCLLALLLCSWPSFGLAKATASKSFDRQQWRLPVAGQQPSSALAKLGRQLFFDPRLLGTNHRSCATCHHPGFAFSLPDDFSSTTSTVQRLERQVPSLLNTKFQRHYFWDARVDESLPAAIAQHIESLAPHTQFRSGGFEWTYGQLFLEAFGEKDTSRAFVARALAAFILSLKSNDTPFDRWIAGERKAISAAAIKGFALFRGKAGCVRCHTPPAFTDSGIHNIGLDSMDPGYAEITGQSRHHNAFRTPSLRHVSRTPPYMHNGVYHSLKAVISHYNKGGVLKGGGNELKPLQLSREEQQQLLSFLQTLATDNTNVAIPSLPLITH